MTQLQKIKWYIFQFFFELHDDIKWLRNYRNSRSSKIKSHAKTSNVIAHRKRLQIIFIEIIYIEHMLTAIDKFDEQMSDENTNDDANSNDDE